MEGAAVEVAPFILLCKSLKKFKKKWNILANFSTYRVKKPLVDLIGEIEIVTKLVKN